MSCWVDSAGRKQALGGQDESLTGLTGASGRLAKFHLKPVRSAVCEHCAPGVSTAQVFSQRTNGKVFDVKGNQWEIMIGHKYLDGKSRLYWN